MSEITAKAIAATHSPNAVQFNIHMNNINRIILALMLTLLTGCTSALLKQSTLSQGATLTDLEYTMVLDNIAMQRARPGSLPWHLKITQGIVQLSDTVNPTLAGTWGSPSSGTATLSATRNWQQSWTVVPEIDGSNLSKLETDVYSKEYSWISNGTPPPGSVSGHYGTNSVYVTADHIADLTKLTIDVLKSAPIKPSERGLILPNIPGR